MAKYVSTCKPTFFTAWDLLRIVYMDLELSAVGFWIRTRAMLSLHSAYQDQQLKAYLANTSIVPGES